MLDRRRKGLSCAPNECRGYDYWPNLRGRSSSMCELLWSTGSPTIDLGKPAGTHKIPGSGDPRFGSVHPTSLCPCWATLGKAFSLPGRLAAQIQYTSVQRSDRTYSHHKHSLP